MPKVSPPLAIVLAVLLHSAISALLFSLPVTPSAEWAYSVFAIAALVLPGALAGFLTRARPLIVGLCAAVAIILVQCLGTYVLLGDASWSFLLAFMPGDALQLLVLCVASVAAYHFRIRFSPAAEAIAG